jgi:aminoglycoside phosphotransferase family enzyme
MTESEILTLAESGYFNGKLINGKVEETHISWVILTKHLVFKIKKPVKLSFLDFSTRTKRKKFCKQEIQLNKRLSNIYMDVVPICKYRNSWHIGKNKGEVKDYAVRMRRLQSDKKMDIMLRRQQAKKENILSLAKAVASFHKKATIITVAFEMSETRALFNDLLSIRKFIHKQMGENYSKIITHAIRWSNKFLRTHASDFQDRIVAGFKRDVHGDLHSGNIFLYKKPIIFDCIEFNDSYRQIDVINEIAFFCMDLEVHKKKSFSNLFLSEYLRHFSCFRTKEDERLFTYFKCYRANVRAKVNAISAQQTQNDGKYLRAVKTHLQLMRSYINSTSL